MKRKKWYQFLLAGVVTVSSLGVYAQEIVKDSMQIMREDIDAASISIKKLQKLRISGYIQMQTEVAQEYGRTRTGSTTTYQPERDGKSGDFVRYGIRRGRVRIGWEEKFGLAVFQFDITERDLFSIRDAFFKVWDPWKRIVTLTAGLFDRPFGDEISFSSNRRESPERSRVFVDLFPEERDLGAELTIASPKGFVLEGLRLDAGLFSGNGIHQDDNSKMDFIGHLKYDKRWSQMSFGIGASMYHGKTNNASNYIYKTVKYNDEWIWQRSDSMEINQGNKRQYFGIDAQYSIETNSGITNIRGEFLAGTQPSRAGSFGSPRADSYDRNAPYNYMRKFIGGHAYLVQDIYKTPLTFVFKYTYINPNTEWKEKKTNTADLAYHTYGFGLLWKITSYIRLQAYYDILVNEKSETANPIDPATGLHHPIPTRTPTGKGKDLDFGRDIADNIFTLRLQYRF